MANPRVWSPDPLPEERTERQVRNISPVMGDGYSHAASTTPAHVAQRMRGSNFDQEYSQVWEQDTEPEEAAVHDFWWDTSA